MVSHHKSKRAMSLSPTGEREETGPAQPTGKTACTILWVASLLITVSLSQPLQAEAVVAQTGDARGAADEAPQTSDADESQRQRNRASAGVLLLLGVVAVGVLVIAGVVISGAKLRRLARGGEPGPTEQDELWYLRTQAANAQQQDAASGPDENLPSDKTGEPSA